MNPKVAAYLERKAQIFAPPHPRPYCLACRKPQVSCYCENLASLHTDPRFVILMHALEARHPVGTGRMAHRCLRNSSLWIDSFFAPEARLDALLSDPQSSPLLLFPSKKSLNLSRCSPAEKLAAFAPGKEKVVIVLDATWEIAKKMLHLYPPLQKIPHISFDPQKISGFTVRKQPNPHCLSTIEAISEVLTHFSPPTSQSAPSEKDKLLEVFTAMVDQQMSFRNQAKSDSRHRTSYLARKARRQKWRALKAQLAERAAQRRQNNLAAGGGTPPPGDHPTRARPNFADGVG